MASLEDNLTFDQDACLQTYIGLLEDGNRSLCGLKNVTRNKETSVESAFNLTRDGPIARNPAKKRAKAFMDQVRSHSKELFVLCGMCTNQAAQGEIYTTNLERLWRWWKNFRADPVLPGLTAEFFIRYKAREEYLLDLSELRKCREVLSRLYPTRDISSLFELPPNDLLSLLDADRGSSQPLPPSPSGPSQNVDELVHQMPSDNSTNPPSPKTPTSPNLLKRGTDEGSPLAKRSRPNPHRNSIAQESDASHLSHDFTQLYEDTTQAWDIQRGAAQNLFRENAVPDLLSEGALEVQFDGDTNRTWGENAQYGAAQGLFEGDTNRTWGEDIQYRAAQDLFEGDTNRTWGGDVRYGMAPILFNGDEAL